MPVKAKDASMSLPGRNHYIAAELEEGSPLHVFGLHYRVDVERIRPGIAYAESQDVADIIAHALNQEVERT